MSERQSGNPAVDASAITLSGLCLIHCLALPILAASLPIAGSLAENEWLHRGFVLLAVPLSFFAILRSDGLSNRALFTALAILGLALLVLGAFVEQLHDYEVHLTVAGAVLLSVAHLLRWRSHAE